jgi:hypothetical protein
VELHDIIRVGFDGKMEDVPREVFRQRIEPSGRPVYIPLNFFLFNKPDQDGVDTLVADELVFQAINWEHSERFDKLALFAFNLSIVGRWTGARREQRRPAMWANAYIRERVDRQLKWNTRLVSADDIQAFVSSDRRYEAKTSRKLATNLNHMFVAGHLGDFPSPRIERWWVDCLFLALDRIFEDRLLDSRYTQASQYAKLLEEFGFLDLTGKRTLEKELAIRHLITLYDACGGPRRFSEEAIRAHIELLDLVYFAVNDPRPRGAVHPTNPRILKSIPAACAMLAKYAGFEDLSPDDLEEFDLNEFVRSRTQAALTHLKDNDIKPIMTAEELMKLTRDK